MSAMRWTITCVGAILSVGALPATADVAPAPSADFGVALQGPAKASVGGRATFRVEVTNNGPDKELAKLRFTRGHGATGFDDGEPVRTTSQSASRGSCDRDPLGVICRLGSIPAEATVKIEVVAKVFADDLPELEMQATVAPELIPEVDPNAVNDHAETSTPVVDPIVVDGLPESCASRPFTVTVKTTVPKAKRTKLIVDHKVIETSAAAKLTAKINPHDLDGASHQLAVVVQGGSGPALATVKRKFKTC